MKPFHSDIMDLQAMANVVGGTDISLDTTILHSRKTRIKNAVEQSENEKIEVSGTITIDKEK